MDQIVPINRQVMNHNIGGQMVLEAGVRSLPIARSSISFLQGLS